ncbi:hypothetical protein H4S07_003281 [Coemansia furcata]|uniref:Uncharacterized protein n=1 Tax=Coemansia furcata TaxID=417177 RepID=A0ACC1LI51_9FUNG|nr:hypothetical protein H4S07_003281 [Coemansia furcata]
MANAETDAAEQPTGATDTGELQDTSSVESTALYEDKYLRVTKQGITVHRYYFPLMNDKFIPWDQIEYVKFAKDLGVRWYALKGWGTGMSDIWWNCRCRIVKNPFSEGWGVYSMEHILESNIVIKMKDCLIRPGSYVENPEKAMTEINKIIQQYHSHTE